MASGKVHDRSVGLTAAAVGLISVLELAEPSIVIARSVGALSGYVLSPDLDLCSTPMRRWEALGLGWFWRPYMKALHHRSVWSHTPIVGTVGRLLYMSTGLGVLATFFVALGAVTMGIVEGPEPVYNFMGAMNDAYLEVGPYLGLYLLMVPKLMIQYACGLAAVDIVHWVLDGFPMGVKRK